MGSNPGDCCSFLFCCCTCFSICGHSNCQCNNCACLPNHCYKSKWCSWLSWFSNEKREDELYASDVQREMELLQQTSGSQVGLQEKQPSGHPAMMPHSHSRDPSYPTGNHLTPLASDHQSEKTLVSPSQAHSRDKSMTSMKSGKSSESHAPDRHRRDPSSTDNHARHPSQYWREGDETSGMVYDTSGQPMAVRDAGMIR